MLKNRKHFGGDYQMKIPDKIMIGGVMWDITFEDLSDANAFGITDFDTAKIRLDINTKEDMIDESFWHEILHIIHRFAGHPLGSDMKHDHRLVDAETVTTHQIMSQIIKAQ